MKSFDQSTPTPAGLFCPKGHYLYCKAPFDCSCVKGVRFAAWWSKRPSPLDPQDAPAPRPGAWLGQRRRRASRLSLYR